MTHERNLEDNIKTLALIECDVKRRELLFKEFRMQGVEDPVSQYMTLKDTYPSNIPLIGTDRYISAQINRDIEIAQRIADNNGIKYNS